MSVNIEIKDCPLVLDLDETLLKTDSLWELFFCAITHGRFMVLCGLLFGRAYFKQRLATNDFLNLALLPWNEEIVSSARKTHEKGVEVWLATAADRSFANKVAEYFGFFSGVLASDGNSNLKGSRKSAALVEKFGYRAFIYAGDSHSDLDVWKNAAEAWVVGPEPSSLAQKASAVCPMVRLFSTAPPPPQKLRHNILRALRPHQWVKNVLLFIPLLLAHEFTISAFFQAFLAFIVFCLLSSSGYLINDLLDIESDRGHPDKRLRPFASGALRLQYGPIIIFALSGAAFLISFFCGAHFMFCALVYLVGTVFYSLQLKLIFLLDVVVLTLLFIVRIISGSVAIGVELSQWMLCLSFFVFATLGLIKRLVELRRLNLEGNGNPNKRRAYQHDDVAFLRSLAAACLCGASLTVALYVGDPKAGQYYASPTMLLFFCPVLFYWLARLLWLAERGSMSYDPVFFALKDTVSHICLGFGGLIYLIASLGVGK